jgi:predicted dehydrogenase
VDKPLPVAVVGAGRVARAVHLPALAGLCDTFRLVAVVDTDESRATEAAAGFRGSRVGTELEVAVAAGARAVLCATPWYTHASIIEECLRNDLHVLCEKPVSLSIDEIDRLVAAEAGSGGTVSAGYMKRHDPVVQAWVREAVRFGPDLRLVTVHVIDPNAPHQVRHLLPPGFVVRGDPGEEDRALGGILGPDATATAKRVFAHTLGGSLIHHINLVGTILAASGHELYGTLCHALPWSDGSAVTCTWRPADRLVVTMTYARTPRSHRYRETVECIAESGRLVLESQSPYARDVPSTLRAEYWDDGPFPAIREFNSPWADTGFSRQLTAWGDAVRGGDTHALPGLAEAARDLNVVLETTRRFVHAQPSTAGQRRRT